MALRMKTLQHKAKCGLRGTEAKITRPRCWELTSATPFKEGGARSEHMCDSLSPLLGCSSFPSPVCGSSSSSSKQYHHLSGSPRWHRASALAAAPQQWTPTAAPLNCPRRSSASCSSTPSKIAWLASVEHSSTSGNGVPLEQQPAFDAILVLAGGLTPDGGLPPWVHRRLDAAYDLHLLQGGKSPILCIGGGTPHKPSVVSPSGHVLHESTSCATYLLARGCPAAAILKETSSYDTVGNAFFSLTIHAVPAGWRRVAVVTSAFHMPRSRALFEDIGALAGGSIFGDPNRFHFTFVSTSDEGIFTDHVLQVRLDKEAGSRAHWSGVKKRLHRLADFHDWFYQEHLCYAVPRQHEFGKRTIADPELLESY